MASFSESNLSRNLSTFDISEELLFKLLSKGYTTRRDIENVQMDQLMRVCSLNQKESESIIKDIKKAHLNDFNIIDCCHLLYQNEGKIGTFSEALDKALDGGIHMSRLTEIVGEGGSGKSQLCMQLCINVQLPAKFGGLEGEAVYIDTEGRFRTERLISMANAAIKYCKTSFGLEKMDYLTVNYLKSHIHHKICSESSDSLINIINYQLDRFIKENPKIRLIIIDTIAQHFRFDYEENYKIRAVELANIRKILKKIAYQNKVAVILTNQVTYSPEFESNIPALGKMWGHVCSTSLIIKRSPLENGNPRIAKIIKSPNCCETDVYEFLITEDGIRDVIKKISSI